MDPVGTKPRALTGIKPTGAPHLGNYLGMIKPALELTNGYDAFYFIADYHALTTMREPAVVREYTLQVAAVWLALGLDPSQTTLFRQSDVPEVTELAWIISCVTPLGLLNRAHSYKDAISKGVEINAGTFNYPVLMAADILAYDSHVVPVGKDQRQHLEITRDMATAFNHYYGNVLRIPEAKIQEETSVIPGSDGRKMSKSYNNTIPLFLPKKQLRKNIMQIVTDSTPLDEPKNPETCNVFRLYKLFANSDQAEDLAEKYRTAGFGYGHAKQALFELVNEQLASPRDKYNELMKDPDTINDVLKEGGKKARNCAQETIKRVRIATGI